MVTIIKVSNAAGMALQEVGVGKRSFTQNTFCVYLLAEGKDVPVDDMTPCF
jgi:hypothetical protein